MTLSEKLALRDSRACGTTSARMSIFGGATATIPDGELSLAEFIDAVRSDRWEDAIHPVRLAVARGESEEAGALKRRLPAVTLSSLMKSRAKDAAVRVLRHTGWLQADFDGKENGQMIQAEIRAALETDPHVGAVFVGPSGQGIKCAVRIDPEKHLDSFLSAERYFLEKYALTIDKACKDKERLCFVSHDPAAWVRTDAATVLPVTAQARREPAPAPDDLPWEAMDVDDVRAALAFIPPRPAYADWMRISSAVFSALPMAQAIQVLNEWSPEEKDGEYEKKWRNRLQQIHEGTLIHYAKQHGFDPQKHWKRKRWMGTVVFRKGAQDRDKVFPETIVPDDHPALDPDYDPLEIVRNEILCGQRGDSRVFRLMAGINYLWDPPARVWRKYDEKTGLWSKDSSKETVLAVSDVCLSAYQALGQRVAQDMRDHPPTSKNDARIAETDAIQARQKQLNSSTYFRQVAELAAMEPGGSRPAPEYDRARHLLAVRNGVFDFEKMMLRGFYRDDALTVACPASYVDEAKCPQFSAFVERAFDGDRELIAYWWRIVGYSLTGYVDHDALFFCYGAGANGKSTAMLTLRMLLGAGLSGTIESHALLTDRPDSTVAYQKASLEGKRLILTDELPEGKKLNESMVKALIGGDNIQARRPYQEPYDFAPTHKIWMVGNHKPRISGTDTGIWRRIHLIPWLQTIPAEERRPRHEMLAAFRAELDGILWSALAGYADFLDRGKRLEPPKAVTDATEEYRQEEDTLGQFLADVITPVQGARVEVRDLFKKYQEWCEATGEKPVIGTANKMTRALKKMPHLLVDRGSDNYVTVFNYAWQ